MAEIIGQRWNVYNYNSIKDTVLDEGELLLFREVGSNDVHYVIGDGSSNAAALYDKTKIIAASKIYSDKAVLATGIPYSNQAVAVFNGQTKGAQLDIMDLENFKNWLNIQVKDIAQISDIAEEAPDERRCVIVGAGETGSPLVPLSLETFKQWLLDIDHIGITTVANIKSTGTPNATGMPPDGWSVVIVSNATGTPAQAYPFEYFKQWLETNVSGIAYVEDPVDVEVSTERRAVMVGAGETGSPIIPLALDRFKEWLDIWSSSDPGKLDPQKINWGSLSGIIPFQALDGNSNTNQIWNGLSGVIPVNALQYNTNGMTSGAITTGLQLLSYDQYQNKFVIHYVA